MIGPEDAAFHPIGDADPTIWAETNYFPFFLPEKGLSGAIYTVFRPGLGVCLSDVTIFDRCAQHWEGLAYTDNQQHIPAPPRLEDYTLRNGLHVTVTAAPRDYRIDYVGIDDTEVHFTFAGLMRPQDFNDPEQDPLAKPKAGGGAWDAAFDGHFDMTGQVSGELVLRGERHPIDCLATMDHSWGPRLERDNGNAVFLQAHFGNDFSINALLKLDPANIDVCGPVLHGYVMDGSNVRALVAGQGSVVRTSRMPDVFTLSLKDSDGRAYVLRGTFMTWAPWAPYASVLYCQGMCRWDLDGREGYGAYQEVLSRAAIARNRLAE